MDIQYIQFGEYKQDTFSFKDLMVKIAASPPAIVALINPHSPTGFCFTENELQALSRYCIKNIIYC